MISKDNILLEKNDSEVTFDTHRLHSETRLFPLNDECSELSIACHSADYSAATIARAVEDAEAHLLNLNVTSLTHPSGRIVIDLRVSHRNAGAVSRSLERYGYTTVAIHSGYDSMQDTLNDRVAQLLARIEM